MTAVGRHLPRGWRDFFFQLSLWLGFALVYQLARGIADRSAFEALQNGILVIDAERALHALVELDIQRTVLHGGDFALEAVNWTYWLSQFAVLGVALLWIYLFRNDAFVTVRGVSQIGTLADTFFASLLPAGAISYLYYADRLAQLPLGVIGVAVGTALLPLLSRQLRAGDATGAIASQNRAIELALLMTLPAALALLVLGEMIIHVLFERGAFTGGDTIQTARTLSAYALGLPAYVLIKVLQPAFFAREDTVTPVKIGVVCLIANIALMVILIWPLAQVGIALATSISFGLNATLLAWLLRRQGLLAPDQRLRRRLPRITLAALLMVALLLVGLRMLQPLPDGLALVLLIALGGGAFIGAAQVLGALQLSEVRQALRRR